MELTALLTSWTVAINSHCELDVAMPTSNQTQTKLATSSTAMATNHQGRMAASSSKDPNTSTMDGHTK